MDIVTSSIIYTPLDKISPNPFQTREREDAEHVKNLAMSIAERGLMQIPVARIDIGSGTVQLAFGHSRLAAFKFLRDAGNPGFDQMPLSLQELDDLQMFQTSVAENLDRKDLTPIEEARAMKVYMDDFHKTSSETGTLFHLDKSTVRNKLRLLDLPEQAQSALGAGQLSEGNARALLTMQRLAPAEKVDQVTQLVAGQNFTPIEVEEKIASSLHDAKEAKEMWGKWQSGNPRGGTGLWLLGWKPSEQPAPKFTDFQKLYRGPESFTVRHSLTTGLTYPSDGETWSLKQLYSNATRTDVPWRKNHEGLVDGADQLYALLDQLTNIPACTACPFYARLNGTHWCGLKACWTQKRTAWYHAELTRVAETTGIQILTTDDGAIFEEAGSWGEEHRRFEKWFEAKDQYLRLRIKYQDYNPAPFTENHCVELVSVHPEAIARINKAKKKEKNEKQDSVNQQQEWRLQQLRAQGADKFIAQVAVPIFSQVLAPMDNLGFLEWLCSEQSKKESRKDKIRDCQMAMMDSWLRQKLPYTTKRDGPTSVGKYLQGVAQSWGISLSEDWLDQAAKFEPGVSMETGEK